MTKKLLLLNDPKISTYTSYGTLFSIMDNQLLPWVYNNFIQIRYAQGWGMFAFDQHHILFKSCPGISFHILPQDLAFSKWKTMKEILVDAIDAGYYLYVFLDRYYLPVTHSYMEEHINHEILIYGYDLEENQVYIADNLQSGKFITASCSFDDIEKAVPDKKTAFDFESEIRFLKVRDGHYECNINPEQIRMNLENYLYSKRTFDLNHEQNFDYGFKAIDLLLLQVSNRMTSELPLDHRAFHLLYEHKVLMQDRLNYLIEHGIVPENKVLSVTIDTLKQDFLLLRNIVIKYNIKKSNELLSRIGDKLRNHVDQEKKFIAELIEMLLKYEETSTPVTFYT